MHSWCLLLPFLEQKPLYDLYHFDESWDGQSLGNVSRGDRTAIELFIAGLQTWDGGLRRVVNSRSPIAD